MATSIRKKTRLPKPTPTVTPKVAKTKKPVVADKLPPNPFIHEILAVSYTHLTLPTKA